MDPARWRAPRRVRLAPLVTALHGLRALLSGDVAMSWSAAQYLRFEEERTNPASDLVARIPNVSVTSAIDIGCGPGNSTEMLLERYPQARVTGIDSSTDMIATARKRLPQVAFEVADIRSWRGDVPYDVILANAVLQWIPGHETLLPALVAKLAVGGSLAVQTPDNLVEPSHALMREVAAQGPWAAKLAGAVDARAKRRGAPTGIFASCAPMPRASTFGARPIPPARRRRARGCRMAEGDGPEAVSRSPGRVGAQGFSRSLRGGDRVSLSG
jgi:SAM-dependent methyltransferase